MHSCPLCILRRISTTYIKTMHDKHKDHEKDEKHGKDEHSSSDEKKETCSCTCEHCQKCEGEKEAVSEKED